MEESQVVAETENTATTTVTSATSGELLGEEIKAEEVHGDIVIGDDVEDEPLEKGQLSPLTGSYLLIVIAEPYSDADRERIIQRLTEGLLTWDRDLSHVDLNCELLNLANAAPEGDEAKNGEKLVQWASENLVVEVLIHSQVNTLLQCMKNLLASFTRHRHIIHAGYTFSGSGSWILQDGTFSFNDFLELWDEPDVSRLLSAYKGDISLTLHTADGLDNGWTEERLRKESFSKMCQVYLNPNPNDKLSAVHNAGVQSFIDYISKLILPSPLDEILQPSDIVGNIRFSHPTLYVFPGGQGDAALFGVNGFNMLIDGGFSRKACFWNFVRHLDRLDAVLLTRINHNSVGGLGAILDRKKKSQVFPQIGHFFGNVFEAVGKDGGCLESSDVEKGEKEGQSKESKDEPPFVTSGDLMISLTVVGQRMLQNLHSLSLKPQLCFRENNSIDPINLYHKVGHGKLDLYVLNPAKDSKELKEFLYKWSNSTAASKMSVKKSGDARGRDQLTFPVLNLVSICALVVWQPTNPREHITRLLFPGSTPQQKIFEALGKLKHLEFLKFPVCSASTIAASHKTKGKSEKLITEVKSQLSSKSNSSQVLASKPATTVKPSVISSPKISLPKATKAGQNRDKQLLASGTGAGETTKLDESSVVATATNGDLAAMDAGKKEKEAIKDKDKPRTRGRSETRRIAAKRVPSSSIDKQNREKEAASSAAPAAAKLAKKQQVLKSNTEETTTNTNGSKAASVSAPAPNAKKIQRPSSAIAKKEPQKISPTSPKKENGSEKTSETGPPESAPSKLTPALATKKVESKYGISKSISKTSASTSSTPASSSTAAAAAIPKPIKDKENVKKIAPPKTAPATRAPPQLAPIVTKIAPAKHEPKKAAKKPAPASTIPKPTSKATSAPKPVNRKIVGGAAVATAAATAAAVIAASASSDKEPKTNGTLKSPDLEEFANIEAEIMGKHEAAAISSTATESGSELSSLEPVFGHDEDDSEDQTSSKPTRVDIDHGTPASSQYATTDTEDTTPHAEQRHSQEPRYDDEEDEYLVVEKSTEDEHSASVDVAAGGTTMQVDKRLNKDDVDVDDFESHFTEKKEELSPKDTIGIDKLEDQQTRDDGDDDGNDDDELDMVEEKLKETKPMARAQDDDGEMQKVESSSSSALLNNTKEMPDDVKDKADTGSITKSKVQSKPTQPLSKLDSVAATGTEHDNLVKMDGDDNDDDVIDHQLEGHGHRVDMDKLSETEVASDDDHMNYDDDDEDDVDKMTRVVKQIQEPSFGLASSVVEIESCESHHDGSIESLPTGRIDEVVTEIESPKVATTTQATFGALHHLPSDHHDDEDDHDEHFIHEQHEHDLKPDLSSSGVVIAEKLTIVEPQQKIKQDVKAAEAEPITDLKFESKSEAEDKTEIIPTIGKKDIFSVSESPILGLGPKVEPEIEVFRSESGVSLTGTSSSIGTDHELHVGDGDSSDDFYGQESHSHLHESDSKKNVFMGAAAEPISHGSAKPTFPELLAKCESQEKLQQKEYQVSEDAETRDINDAKKVQDIFPESETASVKIRDDKDVSVKELPENRDRKTSQEYFDDHPTPTTKPELSKDLPQTSDKSPSFAVEKFSKDDDDDIKLQEKFVEEGVDEDIFLEKHKPITGEKDPKPDPIMDKKEGGKITITHESDVPFMYPVKSAAAAAAVFGQVIRTPDEMAELPVHEEVEAGTYKFDDYSHQQEDVVVTDEEYHGVDVIPIRSGSIVSSLSPAPDMLTQTQTTSSPMTSLGSFQEKADVENMEKGRKIGGFGPEEVESKPGEYYDQDYDEERQGDKKSEDAVVFETCASTSKAIDEEKHNIDSGFEPESKLGSQPFKSTVVDDFSKDADNVSKFQQEVADVGNEPKESIVGIKPSLLLQTIGVTGSKTTSVVITPSTPPIQFPEGDEKKIQFHMPEPEKETITQTQKVVAAAAAADDVSIVSRDTGKDTKLDQQDLKTDSKDHKKAHDHLENRTNEGIDVEIKPEVIASSFSKKNETKDVIDPAHSYSTETPSTLDTNEDEAGKGKAERKISSDDSTASSTSMKTTVNSQQHSPASESSNISKTSELDSSSVASVINLSQAPFSVSQELHEDLKLDNNDKANLYFGDEEDSEHDYVVHTPGSDMGKGTFEGHGHGKHEDNDIYELHEDDEDEEDGRTDVVRSGLLAAATTANATVIRHSPEHWSSTSPHFVQEPDDEDDEDQGHYEGAAYEDEDHDDDQHHHHHQPDAHEPLFVKTDNEGDSKGFRFSDKEVLLQEKQPVFESGPAKSSTIPPKSTFDLDKSESEPAPPAFTTPSPDLKLGSPSAFAPSPYSASQDSLNDERHFPTPADNEHKTAAPKVGLVKEKDDANKLVLGSQDNNLADQRAAAGVGIGTMQSSSESANKDDKDVRFTASSPASASAKDPKHPETTSPTASFLSNEAVVGSTTESSSSDFPVFSSTGDSGVGSIKPSHKSAGGSDYYDDYDSETDNELKEKSLGMGTHTSSSSKPSGTFYEKDSHVDVYDASGTGTGNENMSEKLAQTEPAQKPQDLYTKENLQGFTSKLISDAERQTADVIAKLLAQEAGDDTWRKMETIEASDEEEMHGGAQPDQAARKDVTESRSVDKSDDGKTTVETTITTIKHPVQVTVVSGPAADVAMEGFLDKAGTFTTSSTTSTTETGTDSGKTIITTTTTSYPVQTSTFCPSSSGDGQPMFYDDVEEAKITKDSATKESAEFSKFSENLTSSSTTDFSESTKTAKDTAGAGAGKESFTDFSRSSMTLNEAGSSATKPTSAFDQSSTIKVGPSGATTEKHESEFESKSSDIGKYTTIEKNMETITSSKNETLTDLGQSSMKLGKITDEMETLDSSMKASSDLADQISKSSDIGKYTTMEKDMEDVTSSKNETLTDLGQSSIKLGNITAEMETLNSSMKASSDLADQISAVIAKDEASNRMTSVKDENTSSILKENASNFGKSSLSMSKDGAAGSSSFATSDYKTEGQRLRQSSASSVDSEDSNFGHGQAGKSTNTESSKPFSSNPFQQEIVSSSSGSVYDEKKFGPSTTRRFSVQDEATGSTMDDHQKLQRRASELVSLSKLPHPFIPFRVSEEAAAVSPSLHHFEQSPPKYSSGFVDPHFDLHEQAGALAGLTKTVTTTAAADKNPFSSMSSTKTVYEYDHPAAPSPSVYSSGHEYETFQLPAEEHQPMSFQPTPTMFGQQQQQQDMDEETNSSGDFSDSQQSTIPQQHVYDPSRHLPLPQHGHGHGRQQHNYDSENENEEEYEEEGYDEPNIVTPTSTNSNTTFVLSGTTKKSDVENGNTGNMTNVDNANKDISLSTSSSSTTSSGTLGPSTTTVKTQYQSGGATGMATTAGMASDEDDEDIVQKWGKPLGLPIIHPENGNNGPADPPTSETPKKTPRKFATSSNPQKKRSSSSRGLLGSHSSTKNLQPMYVDLAYVPHHGNSNYSDSEFFRLVRSRYYVFSGLEPSRQVFEGLLRGKQAWEDKNLDVTIIPTYDTDSLAFWVIDSEEELHAAHIDLAPSASRCTINLQDHDTSCSAYRLEF